MPNRRIPTSAVEIIELGSAPEDMDLLSRLHRTLYAQAFPIEDERELLRNMEIYLQLKKQGWYGRNNYHVLVMLDGEQPVGMSISDYLERSGAGVIEFLVVSRKKRHRGLGRLLLDRTEAALQADAAKTERRLDLVCGEMNDPFKSTGLPDSMDQVQRALVWDSWGYRRLRFPYVQAALSPALRPVENLLLMARVLNPEWSAGVPSNRVLQVVEDYQRWAMRIADPPSDQSYRGMAEGIADQRMVALGSLADYVGGQNGSAPFVHKITVPDEPDLGAALDVYESHFAGKDTGVDREAFHKGVNEEFGRKAWSYHLWALREDPRAPVSGMASFFTFPACGFGGYIVLGEQLRSRGLARKLVSRIELAMIADARGAGGWLIECAPASQEGEIFRRLGFQRLPIEYRQPPLTPGRGSDPSHAPLLDLMYKEFGEAFRPQTISAERLRAAVRWIFRGVYRIPRPRQSPFYTYLLAANPSLRSA